MKISRRSPVYSFALKQSMLSLEGHGVNNPFACRLGEGTQTFLRLAGSTGLRPLDSVKSQHAQVRQISYGPCSAFFCKYVLVEFPQ
jgi:hypothetical protein